MVKERTALSVAVCQPALQKKIHVAIQGRYSFAMCDVFLGMRHSSYLLCWPDLAEQQQQGEIKLHNSFFITLPLTFLHPEGGNPKTEAPNVPLFLQVPQNGHQKTLPSIRSLAELQAHPKSHTKPPTPCHPANTKTHTSGLWHTHAQPHAHTPRAQSPHLLMSSITLTPDLLSNL